MKQSKDITPYSKAIEAVEQLTTVEEVSEFTADEDRKTVLEAAENHIETINVDDTKTVDSGKSSQAGEPEQSASKPKSGKFSQSPSGKNADLINRLLKDNKEVYETGSEWVYTNKNLAQHEQKTYAEKRIQAGKKVTKLTTYKNNG